MWVIRGELAEGPKMWSRPVTEDPHMWDYSTNGRIWGEGGGQGHNNVRRGRGRGKEKGKYGERGRSNGPE